MEFGVSVHYATRFQNIKSTINHFLISENLNLIDEKIHDTKLINLLSIDNLSRRPAVCYFNSDGAQFIPFDLL